MILKHDHENIDPSWLTLALPPSPSNPLPIESTSLTPSTNLPISHHAALHSIDASWFTISPKPSPPRPQLFELRLTPPKCPFNLQTFFCSDITVPSQGYSQSDSNIIPVEKDSHQEKQELDHVSLPNVITNTSNSKVYGRRQCNLQSSRPTKRRRRRLTSETVPPPFTWATSKRATVHTLDHLQSELNLKTISGTLQCKFCKFQQNDIQFDLVEKFEKVTKFIEENKHDMHDRAPVAWINPALPRCKSCGKDEAMQPLIGKKRNINWLFMLLGEMIGCCKLEHLKYFCKHSGIHRTGAKDRLIYLTYFGLCKQLQPEGPFNP